LHDCIVFENNIGVKKSIRGDFQGMSEQMHKTGFSLSCRSGTTVGIGLSAIEKEENKRKEKKGRRTTPHSHTPRCNHRFGFIAPL